MESAYFISNLMLWVIVLVLVFVNFALLRQIGILFERVAPAGALMVSNGPAVGDSSPELVLSDFNSDGNVTIGGKASDGKSNLLFFLSPTCPVCETLIPILKYIAEAEKDWLSIILASDGEIAEQQHFIEKKGLAAFPYLLSMELGMAFQVGKLPYAVLIDEAGIVRAHGLTNSREHLESLFEAMDRGIGSIQEYLQETPVFTEEHQQ
tara:strand:- start:37 stop:660 length:624 start_codon:yes stop_codon:yes gene_type:complete